MEQKFTHSVENTTKNSSSISRRDAIKGIGATILMSPFTSEAKNIPKNETRFKTKNEEFIINQTTEIIKIIDNKEYHNIISNPYLAYCLHCMQTYLDKVSDPKNQYDVPEKIIGSIAHLITPEFRAQAILFLTEQTKKEEQLKNKKISTSKVLPLDKFYFSKGKNHENAIDLFTKELSPVYAMEGGLVIIAENGWKPNEELSTSSFLGGNTVIIFNYLTKEFFRYAHLNKTIVKPGDLIKEDDILGAVGHTGKNAAKPGHGQHLHLEIHQYLSDKRTNNVVLDKELRRILEDLKTNI